MSTLKLPKQWKHWCKKNKIYSMYTGQQQGNKFYLVGHGFFWRVNCFSMLEIGDPIYEFDRWALCDIIESSLPRTEKEFTETIKRLLKEKKEWMKSTKDEE